MSEMFAEECSFVFFGYNKKSIFDIPICSQSAQYDAFRKKYFK